MVLTYSRKFISWARSFILILSSHLHLVLQVDLFLSFPNQNPVCTSRLPILATCLAHLIRLDLITRTIFVEEYKSWNFSLRSLIQSPVTLSLLGPNIFLSTLLSDILISSFSLNVTDQVSHPYKTYMPSWPGEGIIRFSVVEEDAWCLFGVAVSVFVRVSLITTDHHHPCVGGCHSVAVCASYLRRAVARNYVWKLDLAELPNAELRLHEAETGG